LPNVDRVLYLAIPYDIYNDFFQLPFTRGAIAEYQVNLVVFDANNEVIVQWKN